MERSWDEDGNGANLQDHLGLAEDGSGNGETLGGGNVAEAEHGEFAANDDDDHPGRHKLHANEGDEGGGDQKFVGDGIEEDAESGYLQAAAGGVAIGAIPCVR